MLATLVCFINIFSRKATGLDKWAKLFELSVNKKNIPLYFPWCPAPNVTPDISTIFFSFFIHFQVIEEKIKTSGRVKQTVNIQVDFKGNNEPRRGRGGSRGGRGERGGRGGRGGRGRGRGGFSGGGFGGGRADSEDSGANFALNSEEFPTLG